MCLQLNYNCHTNCRTIGTNKRTTTEVLETDDEEKKRRLSRMFGPKSHRLITLKLGMGYNMKISYRTHGNGNQRKKLEQSPGRDGDVKTKRKGFNSI